ncbi:MAG: Survival protein SurE [Actinomycetia bacterium]|nr:Survival protein SurE [Actinomycetes bacterium]
MRILVTNDDGVQSPGLAALVAACVSTGHDIVVAAPQQDMSGTGAAIGKLHVDRTIDVAEHELPGLPGVPCHAVDGPPALAVIAAHLGAFGDPPDLVVSGINPGPNTGGAVLHSGTVGAALTAANFGFSGLAVSIGTGKHIHWETAAGLAVPLIDWLVTQPAKTVVNLNAPNLPLSEVRGVRWGELAIFGSVRTALIESQGGRLQMEWVGRRDEHPEHTDAGLVDRGYASLTLLTGVQAAAPVPGLADAVADVLLPKSA